MRIREDEGQRIECFCARKPLLALYVMDQSTRKPVIWVRAIKSGAVQAEVILDIGKIRVRCRECLRLHCIELWPEAKTGYKMELEADQTFQPALVANG